MAPAGIATENAPKEQVSQPVGRDRKDEVVLASLQEVENKLKSTDFSAHLRVAPARFATQSTHSHPCIGSQGFEVLSIHRVSPKSPSILLGASQSRDRAQRVGSLVLVRQVLAQMHF